MSWRICCIQKQTLNCTIWLQLIKSIITQKHVENTIIFHADFILANFSQEQL